MLIITRRKPGGPWYIRGTVAGCSIYESTKTSVKRAAEAIRQRREQEVISRAALGPVGSITFAEAASDYMESGGEGRYLGKILQFFGPAALLSAVAMPQINAAARAIYPTASDSTINRQLITPIRAVIRHASGGIRSRRVDDARTRWLSPAEAARLVDCANPRVRPLILFLLGTGARPAEALQLTRRDLHLDAGQAFLAAETGRQTKGGAPRMVALPPPTLDALRAATLPDFGPIFLTPKGRPYVIRAHGGGQIQSAFTTARDAAGLGADVIPYTCRHTWATWFSAATGDLGGLQDQGGWASARMAGRYRHLAPATLPDDLAAHGWRFARHVDGSTAWARPGAATAPAKGRSA
jgi:integrase